MPFFSDKIKESRRMQIMSKGIDLDEMLKEDVLKELKDKFSEEGELVTSFIRFHLIPKTKLPEQIEVKKGKKKEIIIGVASADFITLDHPSPAHFKDKMVVITSTKNSMLEKFLK